MNPKEQQFSQLVKENRSTIYAVCYMFSNDAGEVADLFQRCWLSCGKVLNHSMVRATLKHGYTV